MLLANTAQIRFADDQMITGKGFPGLLLMETAGRKSAEYLLSAFPHKDHFLILAGPGNNGGDGLVIARYLKWAGKAVQIILSHSPEQYKGDAKANFEALAAWEIEISHWEQINPPKLTVNTLLVDALLGTGISQSLRGTPAAMIEHFKALSPDCVAIDLPSGLSADTGELLNEPIPAIATITFQIPKICHFNTPASNFCGRILVADIGITPSVLANLGIQRQVISGSIVRQIILNRPVDGHKGTFGHALLVGGSLEMPGAIALSAYAALQIGAGLSSVFIPFDARTGLFEQCHPEIMASVYGNAGTQTLNAEAAQSLRIKCEGKNALAIGPGLGNTENTQLFFKNYWQKPMASLPTVIDADGLNILAANPEVWSLLPENTILTPHPGEMKRLTGRNDAQEKRLEIAEELAKTKGVIVVLKGAHTLIALPDGRTWVNPTGNPGMGTAGSGDVLTGTITGLLAQGYSPEQAAVSGVYLHGLAGDLAAAQFGQAGVTASRISDQLSPAIQQVRLNLEPKIELL